MPAKKPTTLIQGCTFQNVIPPTNEHTARAVEALASAAAANAKAIEAAAFSLRGATMVSNAPMLQVNDA